MSDGIETRRRINQPLPRDNVLEPRPREPVLDPVRDLDIELPDEVITRIVDDRTRAVTAVFRTLDTVHVDLENFFPKVPETLPSHIEGVLVNPDGRPAERVRVRALEPDPVDSGQPDRPWSPPESVTDDRGAFRFDLPVRPVPETGLRLRVTGGNGSTEVVIRRTDLVGDPGSVGALDLDRAVTPLAESIIAELAELVPTGADDVDERPGDFASPAPELTLGEDDCGMSFRSNSGVVDRFRYSMLVRLVDPQVGRRTLGVRISRGDGFFTNLTVPALGPFGGIGAKVLLDAMTEEGEFALFERGPIDEPVNVDRFLRDVEEDSATVPKAASLGVGYVLTMRQVWVPTGLSLGDLVYSLPLAPGEQQRIAVSEERDELTVRDFESLSATERQRFGEQLDTSARAVYESAYHEQASGGSRMRADSSGWAVGGAGGVAGFLGTVLFGVGAAGGYSSSSSSGSTSSWQQGSRDYASSAAQDFHSRLSRQASARRDASRTSVRLAATTETEEIRTKVITNHNHCHALTMQYWQVLRHFGVTSEVDDVQLVCFVPLELVDFLPTGQSRVLPTGTYSRDELLARYDMLIRYLDVLSSSLPDSPPLRHGLTSLRSFAANPEMEPEPSTGAAQDVVNVSIEGTFLPFERISVTAWSTRGHRIGPVALNPGGPAADIPDDLLTEEQVLDHLRELRRRQDLETRSGSLAIPDYIARSDIARFEFRRRFDAYAIQLMVPEGIDLDLGFLTILDNLNKKFPPARLEAELGGPLVSEPRATISGPQSVDLIAETGQTTQQDPMGVVYPVPAQRVAPVLNFSDLLQIEALLQHVVQNSADYSQRVWEALTPNERAILLERFTIGVPTGGLPDESQDIPLLNCVANEVLGYYGNAAVMPFHIPPDLAEETGLTSRDVQEALLRFHRQGFVPPQSSLTLPARGVLGEAVLGSCNSCEKIDLTRFWNWKDSPGDEATSIESLKDLFSEGQLVGQAGAQAPSDLTSGESLVTINQGQAAATPPDLVKVFAEATPESGLPEDLTGQEKLADVVKNQADNTTDALKETIGKSADLAKHAMTTLPKVIKAETEVEKAAEDKKDKEKAEKKEQEKKKEEAATAQEAAKLKTLSESLPGILAFLAGQPSEDREGVAGELVTEIFGDDLPARLKLIPLADDLQPDKDDSSEIKAAKNVLLQALGLAPEGD